jgi:hypothetical protein
VLGSVNDAPSTFAACVDDTWLEPAGKGRATVGKELTPRALDPNWLAGVLPSVRETAAITAAVQARAMAA